MTTYAIVFPTALAQLAANRINNTMFAFDRQTRVEAVTAHVIKFVLVADEDLETIDQIADEYDGSYTFSAAIDVDSLSLSTESV